MQHNSLNASSDKPIFLIIHHSRDMFLKSEVSPTVNSGTYVDPVTLSWVICMLHHLHNLCLQVVYFKISVSRYCSTPLCHHKQLVGNTTCLVQSVALL